MTSLHVICGLGPPIKNPGYAYGQACEQNRLLKSTNDENETLYCLQLTAINIISGVARNFQWERIFTKAKQNNNNK